MINYQDIVDAIDALILAKISGATSIDSLLEKTLGDISVNPLSSISELLDIKERYLVLLRNTAEEATLYYE